MTASQTAITATQTTVSDSDIDEAINAIVDRRANLIEEARELLAQLRATEECIRDLDRAVAREESWALGINRRLADALAEVRGWSEDVNLAVYGD